MRRKIRYLCVMTIVLCGAFTFTNQSAAFSDQVVQKGATGDDVVELQARLQYIGYFDGTIDGVFGWGTYWSVREYQEAFGMEVDGHVGDEMKSMLAKSTNYDEQHVQEALENARKFTHYGTTPKEIQKGPKGSREQQAGEGQRSQQPEQGGAQPQEGEQPEEGAQQPPQAQPEGGEAGQPQPQGEEEQNVPDTGGEQPEEQSDEANIHKAANVPDGFAENDIQIMANAVHGEARGEPYVGKVAVAAVIINRMNSSIFPDTASGVIFEPRAFTAVADGQIYIEPDEEARKAVLDAINGQDPSNGAIYYYNPQTATSGWIFGRPTIKDIGKHRFAN